MRRGEQPGRFDLQRRGQRSLSFEDLAGDHHHVEIGDPGLLDDGGVRVHYGLEVQRVVAQHNDVGLLTDGNDPVGNLHRACAELDGAPRGAQLDTATIFADMLAYNGGEPLTCHA